MMYNPIVESEVVIGYLADRPEFVERIARLSWDEWRWIYQNRGATFEYVLKKYRERTNIDRLPLAFVATARVNDRDELVGRFR